jgi:hypothetical protein
VKKLFIISTIIITGLVTDGCHEQLNPKPIDLIVNDVVLNEPKDIAGVQIGLYNAFRRSRASAILAGDLTADNLIHQGTFAQYRELGIKQITTGNATVSELWSTHYATIYIANFMIERIPDIEGVTPSVRKSSMATAYFLRGLSYLQLVTTFGGVPLVTTTDIETNRNIPRATEEEVLKSIEADFTKAAGNLGGKQPTPATACDKVVSAAFARYYLYTKNYSLAEQYATDVISSGDYTLEPDFKTIVTEDFTNESIFEVGYTIFDNNDGTNLNDLFVSRREIIPSNQIISVLDTGNNPAVGDRIQVITFHTENLKGADNGWEVTNYGTSVANNDNIVVFRLAEMYLIRAEARNMLGKVTGPNTAQTDVNTLRARAKAKAMVGDVTQGQMTQIIETERRIELAYEGHRWYDLVRTGRAEDVMPSFNSNWKPAYELWPIPQREIQNNPALVGEQNPGY